MCLCLNTSIILPCVPYNIVRILTKTLPTWAVSEIGMDGVADSQNFTKKSPLKGDNSLKIMLFTRTIH